MERNPITRQRSKWIPLEDDWPGYERNVNDGRLMVLVTEDPDGWHLSISHARRVKGGNYVPGRYPKYDEIADARDEFLPDDLDFVMWFPRSEEYVAVMDTCFHLHEHPPRSER